MLNNTFQAILLLVTFTIRRKKSSTHNTHWKHSCPDIVLLPLPGPRPPSGTRRFLCSLKKRPSVLLKMALDSAAAEEPSVFGAVGATSVLKCVSSTCTLPPHHFSRCRKAGPRRGPGSQCSVGAAAWLQLGNTLRAPLLSENPLQSGPDEARGGWSAGSRSSRHFYQPCFPFFFTTEHTCRNFPLHILTLK